MDALAYRVRDRWLIREAVLRSYTGSVRVASWAPPAFELEALVSAFWETRTGSTTKEAAGGIMRAVKQLIALARRAPKAWDAIKATLGIDSLNPAALVKKLRELAKTGKKALGSALGKAASTFPLSLFFVQKGKAPGLTDLLARILNKSPRLRAMLGKVKSGAGSVDKWLKKYVPRGSKVLYAAIFIWVWLNVAELSWDIDGILRGFTGRISLGDLLASFPESGLGALAAAFGLGYGALPYTLIARLVWLVANHYLMWVPGKGLRVRWSEMGVEGERDELVAV